MRVSILGEVDESARKRTGRQALRSVPQKILMQKNMQFPIVLITLCVWCAPATADTLLRIVTNNGAVSFVADDNWPVLSMQSKLPVAAVVFQLPNAADENTSHATNLVLKLYDQNSEKGKSSYNMPPPQYGASTPKVEAWNGWAIYRQETQKDGVPYTILDAKRPDVGDVAASVRLAWPHLVANGTSYDKSVELRFRQFLQSVKGQSGTYQPQKGEVVRRPLQ